MLILMWNYNQLQKKTGSILLCLLHLCQLE